MYNQDLDESPPEQWQRFETALNQRLIRREFALSGSEQNPDLTGRSVLKTLSRVLPAASAGERP